MVLESLVVPERMACYPERMVVIGFLYSTIGLLLALTVFPSYASISSVFLTSMPLLVVMYNTLKYEEGQDCKIKNESQMMRGHLQVMKVFLFLFIGLILGFFTWYSIMPTDVSAKITETQMTTIKSLRENVKVTGGSVTKSEMSMGDNDFMKLIILNNSKVLIFCIIFSFLYGSGAVFILTWNASVMAAALTKQFSFHYFIHGIPEILSYFIAALAGGIISMAVANHHLKSKEFKKIVVDTSDLILLSVTTLIFSAVVEVYQTRIIEFFLSWII